MVLVNDVVGCNTVRVICDAPILGDGDHITNQSLVCFLVSAGKLQQKSDTTEFGHSSKFND